MPSSSIRRLDIAVEASYMSRNASGVPDPSGLTWLPCEIADATQITAIGDTVTTAVNTSTGGFGTQPGEPLLDPSTNYYGDYNTTIKTGTLTVDFFLRGDVTQTSGQDHQPLLALLSSRMAFEAYPIYTMENVSMTTGGKISMPEAAVAGDVVAYTLPDGRMSYGLAQSATSEPVLRPKQSFSAAYDANGVCRYTDGTDGTLNWSIPSVGGDPISYGTNTVALRITGDGWQQIAYGCAMTALTISADAEGRGIKLSATVDCPNIVDVLPADIETPEWPTTSAGPVLHALGSPFIVGTSSAAAVTYDNAYCASEWTLSLNWTTAGAACGSYWSGRAPLEATSLDASLELTIGHPSAASRLYFETAWQNQTKLTMILPFGGSVNPDSDAKCGGCIVIPGAYVTDGSVSNPDLSADAIQTKVTLGLSNDPADVIPYLFKLFVM